MANLCRVIVKGNVPNIVEQMPCVQWYGENPVKSTEDTILSHYGNNMIYTCNVTPVIDLLIELGFQKDEIFWQDLDGYGSDKIFRIE